MTKGQNPNRPKALSRSRDGSRGRRKGGGRPIPDILYHCDGTNAKPNDVLSRISKGKGTLLGDLGRICG
jgi:hypothetical protein